VDHAKNCINSIVDIGIQENMNILISFVERGLVFTKYYQFPTPVSSFFRSFFTKDVHDRKMTLFQYLLCHHPSDKFVEYLLSNPLFSFDAFSPILVHGGCSSPQSLLLVFLTNNMKNISYSMFKKNESRIISRLESLLSHIDFGQSSHFFLHYLAFIFVVEHEFGNENLMKPFLESGIFKHLSEIPHLKKFKTSMSILLVSPKNTKNEKHRMCRLLLQYGGHFEIRSLENTIEKYREEVENSFDFFSKEKQEEYWDEINDCLKLIRSENQRFERFIEFYFPSALCPLTLNVLYHPLLLADGLSYEKKDFEKWRKICLEKNGPIISPTTNKPLKHEKIEMNTNLLDLIIHVRRVYTTLYLFPFHDEKINTIFSKDHHLHPSLSSLSSLCPLCPVCSNHCTECSNIVLKNVWEEYVQFKSQYVF
jgi:hypothetical protein